MLAGELVGSRTGGRQVFRRSPTWTQSNYDDHRKQYRPAASMVMTLRLASGNRQCRRSATAKCDQVWFHIIIGDNLIREAQFRCPGISAEMLMIRRLCWPVPCIGYGVNHHYACANQSL